MKLRCLFLFAVAASAVGALSAAPAADARSARLVVAEQIESHRRATWRWQALMGVRRTPTRYTELRKKASPAYRRWVLQLWQRRAAQARRKAASPPHRSAWLCLQRYEAAWNANTGNGYYGGLQMDLQFQRTYGADLLRRKGTANRWTPVEQMWVGERALRAGRGFYPWPNAARICGLI